MPRPVRREALRLTAIVAALAAVYFIAAKLGLKLAFAHPSATPVWPPTGIALAAMLVIGYRAWPGVFLGAFLANLTTLGTIWTSAGIATGNTLEALVGASLAQRYARGTRAFEHPQDFFKFAVLAGIMSPALAATLGVTSLALGGFVQWSAYSPVWVTWWLGDAGGALIVAPLLILWSTNPRIPSTREALIERACFVVASVLIGWIVFAGIFGFPFLTVPLLLWAGLRFEQREAVAAIALLAGTAIGATLGQSGPFVQASQNQSLLMIQAFMGIMTLVTVPLAAFVSQHKQAEALLAKQRNALQALYQQERGVAERLQRTLLPQQFPDVPGVALAARYLPGVAGTEVGGDWYDVIQLANGAAAIAIGDVAGRGIEAAAMMGHIRGALRAYAVDDSAPEGVVTRLNNLITTLYYGRMVTLLYLVFEPDTLRVRYVNAGHPPALLVGPGRGAAYLEGARSPALGARSNIIYREATVALLPGSTLVLYTDGLVERPGKGITPGLERIRAVVPGGPADPDNLCDYVLAALVDGAPTHDDVALLVLQVTPLRQQPLRLRLPAAPPSLRFLRRAMNRWLIEAGADAEEAFQITVAVCEGAANVIRHAYGPQESVFEVEIARDNRDVVATVRDSGRWRPRQVDGGRGITVMRGLMAAVEFDISSTGTTVRMRRVLRREAVT